MARKPRIHYPGATYHVMLRGNDGQVIFFSDDDRYHLYLLFQEGIERFGHRLHAFCLMTTHIHLALQVGQVSLSRIMQNLAFRYTRWINKHRRRTGHLFQGRYKAILVDADSYLLELVRYVHLNPVRAGLATNADEYPWSGHRAYQGEEPLPWLTTDWVLSQFSTDENEARHRYRAFIRQGVPGDHRELFHRGNYQGRILGEDRFIERVLKPTEETPAKVIGLDTIIQRVCRSYRLEEADLAAPGKSRLASEARAVVASIVRELPAVSLAAAAERLNRDISSLSAAAGRLYTRQKSDEALASRVQAIRERLIGKQ